MGRTKRKRKRKQSTVRYDELNKVLKLQKALKLKCPKIKINYFSNTGWGVKCKKEIHEGEILIALPLKHLITTSVQCEVFSKLNVESQSPQFILSVFLVYEAHLKEKSKYFNYIETLPRSFTNLYFCTDEEINVLPQFVKKEVVAQIAFIESTVNNLFKIINDKACSHCDESLINIFTKEKFIWAWFIVNTRSVFYQDDKCPKSLALAPFLDLFNHSNDAVTKLFIDFDQKLYILKTNVCYKKYEQVFIKYNEHSNLKLLLEYGFILPDNPNDFIEFSFEEVLQSAKEFDASFGIITKSKYNFIKSNKLNQNLTKNAELSWNFNGLLYVLITMDQNLSLLQSKTYSSSFNVTEKTTMQKISEIASAKKFQELTQILSKMETIGKCTTSFKLAKNLIKSYMSFVNY